MDGFDLFVFALLVYGMGFLLVAAVRREADAPVELPDADSAITAERRAIGDGRGAPEALDELRGPAAARDGKTVVGLPR